MSQPTKPTREYLEIQGLAYYANVHSPRPAFTGESGGEKFTKEAEFGVVIGLNTAERVEAAKKLGLNVIWPGEERIMKGKPITMKDRADGNPYVEIKQSTKFADGSERKFIAVVDKEGNPVTDLIGNGSDIEVRFARVPMPEEQVKFRKKYGHTHSAYLEKVKILNLVPYTKESKQAAS